MSHKGGGWHKPQPAHARRTRATIGMHDTILVTPKASAPKDSWWTRPFESREAFDAAQRDRSLAAGWVGSPTNRSDRR
jgi:hypothetical protein